MDKVFVTRKIPEEGLKLLRENCEVKVWEEEVPPKKEVLLEEIKEIQGLLCLLTDPIDAEVLEAAQNLKVISNYAVGYDNIDIEKAKEKGIVVTNTPGVLTEATADLAFALLLAASRSIVAADNYTRAGKWKSWGPKLFLGQEVFGKTIGIIGAGRIGSAMARRVKGFAMELLYYNRSTKPRLERETGAKKVELEQLLQESDFISIHAPLNNQTENMIGPREFRLMKKTAVLVNTARGAIVNQRALLEALENREIFAAGLDVFAEEPINKNDPLLQNPRVVVAPHIGSATFATRDKMAQMAAQDLLAVLEGKKPRNPVS